MLARLAAAAAAVNGSAYSVLPLLMIAVVVLLLLCLPNLVRMSVRRRSLWVDMYYQSVLFSTYYITFVFCVFRKASTFSCFFIVSDLPPLLTCRPCGSLCNQRTSTAHGAVAGAESSCPVEHSSQASKLYKRGPGVLRVRYPSSPILLVVDRGHHSSYYNYTSQRFLYSA